MSEKQRLEGVSDYARCPECSQVLMSDDNGVFHCITDATHGPYRLYYEVAADER